MDSREKRPRIMKKITCFVGPLVVIFLILEVFTNLNPLSTLFEGSSKVVSNAIIGQEGMMTTISEASLEEVFVISELSTVDYAYNAVAYAYKKDGTTPKYYVAYNGTVTAGIDFSKIVIDIEKEKKIITLTLPNCEVQDTTVDFGSMEYIFKNDKDNTETISQEAYELCQKDLKDRASKEEDLLSLAKENAIAAVEALVNPWVE